MIMQHSPEKTAIKRTTASSPAKYLNDKGLLVGDKLDFGCGYGKDAEVYKMDKYDLTHHPIFPKKKYDTITAQYVLNVETKDKEQEILNQIKSLLKKGGKAYITVRRDLKQEGLTSKGTYQRNVILNLPVVYEKKGSFCIYIIE
jgi:cyclopropane fatty-acyl-phospholipid synthase-like methyltransferase